MARSCSADLFSLLTMVELQSNMPLVNRSKLDDSHSFVDDEVFLILSWEVSIHGYHYYFLGFDEQQVQASNCSQIIDFQPQKHQLWLP